MKAKRHPVLVLLVYLILSIASPLVCAEVFQAESWVPSWSCLGVFDNSDRKGMDRNPFQDFGSESECLFSKETRGKIRTTSPTLILKTAQPDIRGFVDFVEVFGEQNNKFAYGWTSINCPMEGYAILRAGSDDGIKVWINGKEVLNHIIDRAANPDQELIPVLLSKGENRCVVKLDQAGGDWGFYFCFTKIMPQQQGVQLKPVLDIIPPNIIVGSASPVHQFLYINFFNHVTVSGDNLRISCHSPILKETFSESSDFPIRQIKQVALQLKITWKYRQSWKNIRVKSGFSPGTGMRIVS